MIEAFYFTLLAGRYIKFALADFILYASILALPAESFKHVVDSFVVPSFYSRHCIHPLPEDLL